MNRQENKDLNSSGTGCTWSSFEGYSDNFDTSCSSADGSRFSGGDGCSGCGGCGGD